MNAYRDNIDYTYLYSLNTKALWIVRDITIITERGEKMSKLVKVVRQEDHVNRWNEGLVNHERLKRILPFLNEDEGYL